MTKLKVYGAFLPEIMKLVTFIGLPIIYILSVIAMIYGDSLDEVLMTVSMTGIYVYITVFDMYAFGGILSSKGDGAPVMILSSNKGIKFMKDLFRTDVVVKSLEILIPTLLFIIFSNIPVITCLFYFVFGEVAMIISIMITRHFDNMLCSIVTAYIGALVYAVGASVLGFMVFPERLFTGIIITIGAAVMALLLVALGMYFIKNRMEDAYNA